MLPMIEVNLSLALFCRMIVLCSLVMDGRIITDSNDSYVCYKRYKRISNKFLGEDTQIISNQTFGSTNDRTSI